MLAASRPTFAFPGARRGYARDHVLHDRHHRAAEGRLLQPSPARAAHASPSPCARGTRRMRRFTRRRRLHADHADVPRARLGRCPMSRPCSGVKQVYPGRYVPDVLLGLIAPRRRDVLALRADDPADDARQPGAARRRPARLEGHHRRLRAAAAARARGGRARHRHHRRLRHVGDLPHPHARASAPAHARRGTSSARLPVPVPGRAADSARATAHRRREHERRRA